MPGALILINGFPGVGKHAVALELAKLLPDCRFFDTRNLIAAASQLYETDDPAHGLLRKNLKHAIFDSIAHSTTQRAIYILTDFLSVSARAADLSIMREFIAFAQRSGFAFIHVILSCAQDVNVARMLSPERVAARERLETTPTPGASAAICTDTDHLIQLRMEEEIGHIAPVPGLSGEFEIDTSRMDARTAAGVLAEYCLDALRVEGWWIQLVPKAAGVVSGGR